MTNSQARPPPEHPTCPQCPFQWAPGATGEERHGKPPGRKWGCTKGDRKGGGQPRSWRVCRAARPGARHSFARSLRGMVRNARGVGRAGLGAQPERVREGAGPSPSERQLRTSAQSWGGGSSASARGGREKQGGAREGGRPPPTQPARALALPQRPRVPTGR